MLEVSSFDAHVEHANKKDIDYFKSVAHVMVIANIPLSGSTGFIIGGEVANTEDP